MYSSAFLGCGPRARGHAAAYAAITRSQVVAACDTDAARLTRFADEFGIERRYSDARAMLERERPDVLHIVTNPDLRVPLMTLAAEHEVPAAIVEKPLLLDATDFRAITALGERCRTKFVTNVQLRHHPKVRELQRVVAEGRIGQVRSLEASARLNISGQGSHIVDLLFAFHGNQAPATLFGQASATMDELRGHPAPASVQATFTWADGVRGALLCGANAPSVADLPAHMHKRIAVHGTHGYIEWQMNAWERLTRDGGYEHGVHRYADEDILGQRALTEAGFDWLDDEAKIHPNNLATSLAEVNLILALYDSALRREPVALPFAVEGDLLPRLQAATDHGRLSAG